MTVEDEEQPKKRKPPLIPADEDFIDDAYEHPRFQATFNPKLQPTSLPWKTLLVLGLLTFFMLR